MWRHVSLFYMTPCRALLPDVYQTFLPYFLALGLNTWSERHLKPLLHIPKRFTPFKYWSVFCYFLRFLRHFCTRDKYWRVVGYRSARYLSLGKTVVSHLKKLYIKRQKFDIVDWHCDVIIEVAIWLLHLKLRKNLTRYIELFFCQNEDFWWKFCLNAIKLLEVVSVKKTIKKEFQQFNWFITLFG